MSEQALPSKNRSPRYDTAIKLHAVEQVLLHHQAVAQVARQLQCSLQSVANWVKRYQNDARSNPSQKSKSTLSHPTGQASSCQPKKPLSRCSRSAQASPHHTTFLPVEVGEICH
jgi:transposase-like protein